MTVGICAITQYNSNDTVVFSSDRMVTVGSQGGVEYEDTEMKMEELVDNEHVSAVGVGAGVSTFIDSVFNEFHRVLGVNDKPRSVRFVSQILLTAFQNRVQEAVKNQVTQPYGYTLEELKKPEVEVPSSLEQKLAEEVDEIVEASKQVQILLGGVGSDGAEIYQITGMDSTVFTDVGYSVVGSGTESARLTFIRREYDKGCELAEGVFTVLEAKRQAEERQGVGAKSDLKMVSSSGIRNISDSELQQLNEMLGEIQTAEQEAREKVIDEWDGM